MKRFIKILISVLSVILVLSTLISGSYAFAGDFETPEIPIDYHEHSYVWKSNSTQHWKECSECKTKLNNSIASHVYDNNSDKTCNVCGYVRTVPSRKINAPDNLKVSSGKFYLKVTFSAVTGADGYTIYNKTTGKSYNTTSNSYVIKWLKPGKVYDISIKAYYKDGQNKVYSDESAVFYAPTVPMSTILKLKSGSNQITADYKKVGGATSYEIVYATNLKFSNAKTITNTSTNVVIKNLTAGKYFLKVRAVIKTKSATVYCRYSFIKSVKLS